jgi:hypothetical protein
MVDGFETTLSTISLTAVLAPLPDRTAARHSVMNSSLSNLFMALLSDAALVGKPN